MGCRDFSSCSMHVFNMCLGKIGFSIRIAWFNEAAEVNTLKITDVCRLNIDESFFSASENVNVIGLHVQIRLQNWFDTIVSCASGLLALYFCCCCFQSMNAISSLKMFSALVNASPMYLNTARHRRALTMIQSLNSDSKNNQCWVYKRKYFEKYFNKKRANKIT